MTPTFIQQAEQNTPEANSMHPNHFLSQRVTESVPCLFPADLPACYYPNPLPSHNKTSPMAAQEPQPITVLLQQWHADDPSALASKFLTKGSGHGAG